MLLQTEEFIMTNVWLASSVWLALALLASIVSIRVAISVALIEIVVGAIAGNTIGLDLTPWVNYLAGFGAILLTFLAGTEIEMKVIRNNLGASVGIGLVGFFAPYLGVLAYVHYGLAWPWPQAQIAGIALSTTSVAVVYAVMVETGFNKTELGKIILAACFINDLGTVLALGIVFAHYDLWLAFFGAATAVVLWLLPRFAPWFFKSVGHRVSEPQAKFVILVLLSLGGLSQIAGSEAVLPAYLIGMALAPAFLKDAVAVLLPIRHVNLGPPEPLLRTVRADMSQRQHPALHRIGNRVRHRLRTQQLRQVGPSRELLVKRAHLHAGIRRRPHRIWPARHDSLEASIFSLNSRRFLLLQQRREQRLRAHREFLHLQRARLVHMQHQLEGVLHRRLRRLLRLALALVHRFLHVRLVIFEVFRRL